MFERSLTWEEASHEIQKVQGPKRHTYLVSRDIKSVNSSLHRTAIVEKRDELNNLLVEFAINSDPRFIVKD